ncbi:MAG: DUF4198 domain-containing protein [Spirochaetota bacterium]
MKKIAVILSIMLIPIAISAHDVWVSVDGKPEKGKRLIMQFPSGHTFPASNGEFVRHEYMAKTYIVQPDGSRMQVVKKSNDRYQSVQNLDKEGTYMVVSGKKWLYWTQTTQGWKEDVSKTQVKRPLKGIYSGKFTKSFISTGSESGKAWSTRVGHELEILPQNDPASLEKGDMLVIRVLFKGEPFNGTVFATYDTYSEKKDNFALSISKGKKGVYRIPIHNDGKWLIKAGQKVPKQNDVKCDEVMYSSTITFSVK